MLPWIRPRRTWLGCCVTTRRSWTSSWPWTWKLLPTASCWRVRRAGGCAPPPFLSWFWGLPALPCGRSHVVGSCAQGRRVREQPWSWARNSPPETLLLVFSASPCVSLAGTVTSDPDGVWQANRGQGFLFQPQILTLAETLKKNSSSLFLWKAWDVEKVTLVRKWAALLWSGFCFPSHWSWECSLWCKCGGRRGQKKDGAAWPTESLLPLLRWL